MAVDPDKAVLNAFATHGPDGPFVMLNLLRFTPDGRRSYEEYSRRAAVFLSRYGGELLYAGDGDTPLMAGEGQTWDAVLLVRYPSREAFSSMVTDPDYQQITALRTRALSEAVLQPTAPWASRLGPRPS
ncbi:MULTISPECIES: DUF1330 domain-containing protein [unclassified Streptomyces]|uniref:DUF1330 domain-containing protein n=1 Tax=unclassified Streptomyces TaxID=2593676 RepID=UPI0024417F6E|nr:DUF1330 domain-containing protein [Streptomyces sp. DH41]MDG9722766.1 DUF1330 domain-containing protein [Streptomyces sp. DH41]